MFRKFSEETMRRRGGDQQGRDGVEALVALDAVLKGERLMDGALLEPLSAFTNLLQSGQLPPDFGDYSFGDALLAIEHAHADRRQNEEQRWEFDPSVPSEKLPSLRPFLTEPKGESPPELAGCVLETMRQAKPGSAVVVGALSTTLPLAKLAAYFERLTLSDLDLPALEELARRELPDALRGKVRLERYDVTGSYVAFAEGVASAVASATDRAGAEQGLLDLMQSYDVGAGSAGLTEAEGRADFALSPLLLTRLGSGYEPCVQQALASRGWQAPTLGPRLGSALELLIRLVEQHHIAAVLRRAELGLLVSAVSEVQLSATGKAAGPPSDLLGVEGLAERLPEMAQLKRDWRWEWHRSGPDGEKARLLTLVEAVLV